MSIVGDLVGGIFGGDDAADAATEGAAITAAAQQDALDYLKETEAIPQQFREAALTQLGGLYGLEGGEGSQQQLIDQAMASPLYSAIMGGQEAAEEAILRQASATGGLRSGNVQAALADQAQQLQNQALLESYNQQLSGLTGLASLPSNAAQIAEQTAGIGQTLGQGQVAAGQAQQSAIGQGFETIISGAGLFDFSDSRLKDDIQFIGTSNGHNIYKWIWNKAAEKLGMVGEGFGVLADEVELYLPEAIGESQGYKTVNYQMIGANNG